MVLRRSWLEVVLKYDMEVSEVIVFKIDATGMVMIYKSATSTAKNMGVLSTTNSSVVSDLVYTDGDAFLSGACDSPVSVV